ncbi:MAG TPA: ABC transporter permease [Candidatus Dormibacteraeota bacterium]|jgi:oligopeptide transport system permease protein|nr:ABC transporter permease [Candidatus Dormibacteraeota bacterium]
MAQAVPVAQPDLEATYEVPEQVTLLTDAWRRIRRNRLAIVGGVIILILLVTAAISVVWTPYPVWLEAVGPTYEPPSPHHLLGLDAAGRDILSRIMGGSLITVQVGLGSALIVSLIGIPLGLSAGFYRGRVDTVISFFINIWYGIPDLLVALILVFVLSDALHLIPRGVFVIILAFSLTRWMDVARLVRGQALALREREFVEAARMSGARDFALLFRHIFPNALGPIIVQATFAIPAAVLFEAFLSFLGLGLPSPTPSWGAMAADGYHGMDFAPHIVLAPTIALSLTLMAFNWVGDGLRDAFDPRMRR